MNLTAFSNHALEKNTRVERAVRTLMENQIVFHMLSNEKIRVGLFDFWPATGNYKHSETGKMGKGIFNLLKDLKNEKST